MSDAVHGDLETRPLSAPAETTFWKYHGLGNDFVLVDRRGQGNLTPEVTRAVCARHTGVGADGILGWFEEDGQHRMRVFNADGSIADMCGNGLRCFVRWLIDTQGVSPEPLTVLTDAGPQQCIPRATNGVVDAVTVNLGAAVRRGQAEVNIGNRSYRGEDLSLGNPHYVITRAPNLNEAGVNGPGLATHPHFPNGTNVEWLNVTSPTTADLVVYERGVGLTQACGTGGGGAAAIGVALGLMDADTELTMNLPGGALRYTVAADLSEVWMTGPALPVFQGTVAL